jgi:hypothetical protein
MKNLILSICLAFLSVQITAQKVDILGDAKITGQVEVMDTIIFSDGTQLASACLSALFDADSNTGIDVEKFPNEDTIRFFIAGTEVLKLDAKTLHLEANDKGVYIGKAAGQGVPGNSNTWNTVVGYEAGKNASAASSSTLIGAQAGGLGNGGSGNVMIGVASGSNNAGTNNTMIGISAGQLSGTGSQNTYIGQNAGWQSTGSNNIFIGQWAGQYLNANDNIAIGRHALSSNSSLGSLVAIGDSSLASNGIGATFPFQSIFNTAVGTKSLKRNRLGLANTAIGYLSLENNDQGIHNTGLGYRTLNNNVSGIYNTALGSLALHGNQSGQNNTAVGYEAGRFAGGSKNTFVGTLAGNNNVDGDGNVFIGNEAGLNETGSNRLVIANSGVPNPLIYGEFDSSMVRINGKLNINNVYDLPSTVGTAGQVLAYDGNGKAIWSNPNITSSFSDTDGDTYINLELNPDEDVIRFFADSAEIMQLGAGGTSVQVSNDQSVGVAIHATAHGLSGRAVVGEATLQQPGGHGGYFVSKGNSGVGVFGLADNTGSSTRGGFFESQSPNGYGVYGLASGIGNTANYGGYFQSFGANGYGVFAKATAGNGIGLYAQGVNTAAFLDGDVRTTGTLSLEQLGSDYSNGIEWKEASQTDFSLTYGNESQLRGLKIQEHIGTPSTLLYLRHTGKIGINTETPAYPLDIQGNEDADYIARIRNLSTTDQADGLLIELETSLTGNQNEFITFKSGSGVAGRIEGFKYNPNGNFTDRPDFSFPDYFDLTALNNMWEGGSYLLSEFATCVFSPTVCPPNPIPPFVPSCDECTDWLQLPLLNLNAMWAPQMLNTAFDDLSLAMDWGLKNGLQVALGDPYNIQLLDDPDYWDNIAFKKNGGITYGSKGADYAEWLERDQTEQKMQGGQIVGVRNGKISLNTDQAEQLLVISIQPIVLGNLPEESREEDYEKVAFLGQAPVWVIGQVASGDYIIPSGNHDGYGIPISPEEVTIEHVPHIIGRAWEDSKRPINLVNMAIGLKTNEMAFILQGLTSRMENLEDRMAAMEKHLGSDSLARK